MPHGYEGAETAAAITTSQGSHPTRGPDPELKRLIIPAGGRDGPSDPNPSSADSVRDEAILGQVGTDLDQLARAGKLDPVIGRDDVVRQILEVLLKRRKPNVCLVGDAGCGKTALAEAVALEIAEGAPRILTHACGMHPPIARIRMHAHTYTCRVRVLSHRAH